ncbi:MAG: hypothetical protein Q9220_007107 [cf. Caloplaca sp. 1 TL-2023]
MPRPSKTPKSNEQILYELRCAEEWRHRSSREYFFDFGPLDIPVATLPVHEKIELQHVQDSCNKSTAIYITNPKPEPHTAAYNHEGSMCSDLIYTIYGQWFTSHNVDIDFGNFFAKLICARPSAGKQATVKDIIKTHRIWCDYVERTLPSCATSPEMQRVPWWDRPYNPDHGVMEINSDQNDRFKLRPLFRALILIADTKLERKGGERVVQLIQTNLAHLSAPIDFASIEPKFYFDSSKGRVTTTLSAAYDFVTALELREQAVYPRTYSDSEIGEEFHGRGCRMKEAKEKGYTGPELQGSSSRWVHLKDNEEVLPPNTRVYLRIRCQLGFGPPPSPWTRQIATI